MSVVVCPLCSTRYQSGVPMKAERRCGKKIYKRGMVRGYCSGVLTEPKKVHRSLWDKTMRRKP